MRNIYNREDIDIFTEGIIVDCCVEKPEIKNWIRKRLPKYLIEEYPDVKIVCNAIDSPSWVKRGIDSGNLLEINFDRTEQIEIKMLEIVEYFESLTENELKKIYKITFNEAVRKFKKWELQLLKTNNKIYNKIYNKNGERIVRTYSDGTHWVRLLTPKSLKCEGFLMGSCLFKGSYDRRVIIEKSYIYSLRDCMEIPYCNIEVLKDNSIAQIKGYDNHPVMPEFIIYVLDFINNPFELHNNYDIVHDLEKISMIKINGKITPWQFLN